MRAERRAVPTPESEATSRSRVITIKTAPCELLHGAVAADLP